MIKLKEGERGISPREKEKKGAVWCMSWGGKVGERKGNVSHSSLIPQI